MKAKISEIFKSIQGEGIYQGFSQIFVRFFGCNLACRFCDTRLSLFQEFTLRELLLQINSFSGCHSVSITGGEPLLQADFLGELTKELKRQGQITYLETNGTLPHNLGKIIDNLDIVAMDFKLPSSTGENFFLVEHKEFLKIAKTKEVFIKAVIGKDTQIEDIKTALAVIKEIGKETPLILQPENPFEDELKNKLEGFKKICQKDLIDVRVISQLHKRIGVR